jgi:hypothetical protein
MFSSTPSRRNVEQIDTEFLLQLAPNGRFGCLTELDASAQGPVEDLVFGGVVILENEEIVTTTWNGQGDRADVGHPLKLSKRSTSRHSIVTPAKERAGQRASASTRSSAADNARGVAASRRHRGCCGSHRAGENAA